MPQSRRYPSARYSLPAIVDPPDTICFKVNVPNDIAHIMAFYGQIYALGRAYTWGNDTAHTARDVAAVWRKIFDALHRDNCECSTPQAGADEGVEQMIRQNPTNPCLLETSINGTDWCVFADLSKCVPASGQPGSGSQQPAPGGGQACYEAVLPGNGKWLLPSQVSTGDVITISGASGAATDGTGIWYCPNGQQLFLGACVGLITTSGTDPLNTVGHMRLIAKIGSVYYDAYNTSITVPSGITNANVEFQVNDSSLSDNYGELTFKACRTNNAAATFTHTFDFTVSNHNWLANGVETWTPGVGWQCHATSSVQSDPYIDFTSRTLTSVTIYFTGLTGTFSNQILRGGAGSTSLATGIVSGTSPFTWNGSQASTEINLLFNHSGAGSGDVTITKVVVTGLGTDPF